MSPDLSILIAFSGAHLPALRSVASALTPLQDFAGTAEVILLDNGSIDPIPATTARLLPDAVRHTVLDHPRPTRARALNIAVRLARADTLLVLFDTPVLTKGALAAGLATARGGMVTGLPALAPGLRDLREIKALADTDRLLADITHAPVGYAGLFLPKATYLDGPGIDQDLDETAAFADALTRYPPTARLSGDAGITPAAHGELCDVLRVGLPRPATARLMN